MATLGRRFAIGAVLLLFLPYDYFIGSFARFSFFAQVVSEMFAVAMWLALVLVGANGHRAVAAALFGIAGVGVFLTWPVWIGPPVLVLLALALDARRLPARDALALPGRAHLAPSRIVAALHAVGTRRVGGDRADRRRGILADARRGSAGRSLLLSVAGTVTALRHRSSRVTVVLLAAVALQALALFVVARVSGADSPVHGAQDAALRHLPDGGSRGTGDRERVAAARARRRDAAPSGWPKQPGLIGRGVGARRRRVGVARP